MSRRVCAVLVAALAACAPPVVDEPIDCDGATGVGAARAAWVIDPDDATKLVTVDGEPYPLVGINRFNVYRPESNGGGLSPAAWLAAAKDAGVAVVRVFVPEGRWLEPEPGVLGEDALAEVDEALDEAAALDLGVVLALFDHYSFHQAWTDQAASTFGPTPEALFLDARARDAAATRTAAMVRRWQDHPALAAWEPMNELNGVADRWRADPTADEKAEALRWFAEMAAVIRAEDDVGHVITQSLIGDTSWPELWTHDDVDVVQLHTYATALDVDGMALHVDDLLARHGVFGKPVFIGEFGVLPIAGDRTPILREAVEVAAARGSAAFVWTHVDDPYGDVVPDDVDAIYGGARCLVARQPPR